MKSVSGSELSALKLHRNGLLSTLKDFPFTSVFVATELVLQSATGELQPEVFALLAVFSCVMCVLFCTVMTASSETSLFFYT